MNSITYLSKQLDSRSSSKLNLQPSTGSGSGSDDDAARSRPQLPRSKTWSKPFFFRKRLRKPIFTLQDTDEDSDESLGGGGSESGSSSSRQTQKKRSLSSPALFLERNHNGAGGSKTHGNGSNNPIAKAHIDLTSSAFLTTSPPYIFKDSFLYNHFRNTYLVRSLVAIWNCLCFTYERLLGPTRRARPIATIIEEEVDTSTSADERESDADDEGLLMLSPVTRASVRTKPDSLLPPLDLIAPSIPPRSMNTLRTYNPTPPSPLTTPSPTPPPQNFSLRRQTPFHLPKTLVLDLDETLIHSTSRPMYRASGGSLFGFEFGGKRIGKGHAIEVVLNGRRTQYHVYKRPFVDYFLRKVSSWYTLVIFTASMQEYADPVIDWLDAGKGVLRHRLFRDSCTQLPNGSYTKDLSLVEDDLSRVCLVDNSPICYSGNPANGIPIEGWTHDLSDEALLDLLPVLDSLRFTSDVRRVLGLRGFS